MGDLQKMLEGKLKQLNPMMEQVKKMVGNLPNLNPIAVKQTSVGKTIEVKASLMENKMLMLEFKSKEEATEFYNSLK